MQNTSNLSTYFFATLLVLSFLIVAAIFLPYLNVFILSIVLGILFHPFHNKILGWIKIPALASAISVLIIILILLFPVALVGSQLFIETRDLYLKISGADFNLGSTIENIEEQLQNYFPNINIDLKYQMEQSLRWMLEHVGPTFSGAAQSFLNIFLSIIALYYWFKEGDKLRKYIIKLSPLPDTYDQDVSEELSITVRSIIQGSIVIAIIQGILSGIGFYLFGVPNAVLWGSITLISSLIPSIGTALVIAPAIIYLIIMGSISQAMGLALWGVVIVGLIDNLLGPKLMSQGTRIHPFFILISVLGGIRLLGPIGFLAGPLAVSLLFSLLDIYSGLKKDTKIASQT